MSESTIQHLYGDDRSLSRWEKEKFDAWYKENALDYDAHPIGSKKWYLEWKRWQENRKAIA